MRVSFIFLSRDLTRVNVYVDGDGKIHFVNSGGADSVLPFSAGKAYKGTFSDTDSNRGNAIKIDLKPLIDWWGDVNLSVAVITNVSADNNIQSFSYATTKYDNQTGVLTITQSGGSRTFSGKFVVAKAGDENLFI